MPTAPCPPADLPFLAAAFAARAHRHHTRKDGVTPYVSHVFRVALVVRHTFGYDDPQMLAAALLHDTIEDTNTDRDDIIEGFGEEVGAWVAALTKNTILPNDEREAEYSARLCAAPWQVQAIKLADIYDNLTDSGNLPPEKRDKPFKNARRYLDALRPRLRPEARPALDKLEERFPQLRAE